MIFVLLVCLHSKKRKRQRRRRKGRKREREKERKRRERKKRVFFFSLFVCTGKNQCRISGLEEEGGGFFECILVRVLSLLRFFVFLFFLFFVFLFFVFCFLFFVLFFEKKNQLFCFFFVSFLTKRMSFFFLFCFFLFLVFLFFFSCFSLFVLGKTMSFFSFVSFLWFSLSFSVSFLLWCPLFHTRLFFENSLLDSSLFLLSFKHDLLLFSIRSPPLFSLSLSFFLSSSPSFSLSSLFLSVIDNTFL